MIKKTELLQLSSKGITMIELLITIAIIAIISSIAIMNLNTNKTKLKSFVTALTGNINKTKMLAISTAKYMYIEFYNNGYKIIDDNNTVLSLVKNNNIIISSFPTSNKFTFSPLGRTKAGSVIIGYKNCGIKYKITLNDLGRVTTSEIK